MRNPARAFAHGERSVTRLTTIVTIGRAAWRDALPVLSMDLRATDASDTGRADLFLHLYSSRARILADRASSAPADAPAKAIQ
jgi:hypothetical protein